MNIFRRRGMNLFYGLAMSIPYTVKGGIAYSNYPRLFKLLLWIEVLLHGELGDNA